MKGLSKLSKLALTQHEFSFSFPDELMSKLKKSGLKIKMEALQKMDNAILLSKVKSVLEHFK